MLSCTRAGEPVSIGAFRAVPRALLVLPALVQLLLEIRAPGGGQVGVLHEALHGGDIVFLLRIDLLYLL